MFPVAIRVTEQVTEEEFAPQTALAITLLAVVDAVAFGARGSVTVLWQQVPRPHTFK